MTIDGHPTMHEVHLWIVGEVASAVAVLGTLAGILPSIVSLAALLWYGVMLYDWMEARRKARAPVVPPPPSTPCGD